MSRKAFMIRAAAIGSSVTLLGAFVAYRVGAFDRLVAPNRAEFMSGSKTKVILTRGDVEELQSAPGASTNGLTVETGPRTFMVGSKYAVLPTPEPLATSAKAASSPSPPQ
jgi:hypothetical protein